MIKNLNGPFQNSDILYNKERLLLFKKNYILEEISYYVFMLDICFESSLFIKGKQTPSTFFRSIYTDVINSFNSLWKADLKDL